MPENVRVIIPNFRVLTADDLAIGVAATAAEGHGSSAPDAPVLPQDHPLIVLADRLSQDFGGVIFTGPPGTGKSYVAAEAARIISSGAPDRVWFIQFHASYQYEDFMLGYVPDKNGFTPRLGPFLEACKKAEHDPHHRYVVVIDELSRADVGRVFGEAFTYVDRRKRELPFTIASGEVVKVPSNLVILATMNSQDRGVDEVDAAFERRFAKIGMDPDPRELQDILAANDVDDVLRQRITTWFRRINNHAQRNPAAAVGHVYFIGVTGEASLRDLWEYQLKFLVERAFRLDRETGADMEAAWEHIFTGLNEGESTVTPDGGEDQP